MWLPPLLAQTAPTGGDLIAWVGPFAAAAAFATWFILTLISRDKARDAEIKMLHQENSELRNEIRDLNSRTYGLVERSASSMTDNARLLSDVADELRRARDR